MPPIRVLLDLETGAEFRNEGLTVFLPTAILRRDAAGIWHRSVPTSEEVEWAVLKLRTLMADVLADDVRPKHPAQYLARIEELRALPRTPGGALSEGVPPHG